jgi:hypothetical protein
MLIEINAGHTIITVDRIAAVHATTSGRTKSLSVHVAHSAPLHIPYGEDADRCAADLHRLSEALRELHGRPAETCQEVVDQIMSEPHPDGGPW